MPRIAPGAFSALLQAKRGRLNAQFAEARRRWPSLDPDAFGNHLAGVVAPLVEAVAGAAPERAETAAEALYILSLELMGRDFLGPNARYPAIARGWAEVLPALPERLAQDPRRLASAVTNALYNLATTDGGRPGEWSQALVSLSPLCASLGELLRAAQPAAWRAGMAHYRANALQVCRHLPPALAAAALGLPPDGPPPSAQYMAALLDRLEADPWLHPATAADGEQRLALTRRVGAFRGFGGRFLAPPRVSCPAGQFVVTDGEARWLLHADVFGATLHRIEHAPEGKAIEADPSFKLRRNGQVLRGPHQATLPELENSLSAASNATTLAVTAPLSHAVCLVAVVQA